MNVAVLSVGGGGAALSSGAYLSAIYKSGQSVNQVHGASSGAINASFFHLGAIGAMKELWLRIRNKDVYRESPLTWAGLAGKKASCYDPTPLYKLLRRELTFCRSAAPLFCTVTDVESLRTLSVNMNETKGGDPYDWLAASASPPFFFPPVEILGKRYTDGGLGELINISFAIKQGADTLIICCPRGKGRQATINNGLEAIKFAITMPLDYMLEKELRFVELMNTHPDKREIKVIVLRPEDTNQPGILDFDGWGDRLDRECAWRTYEEQAMRVLDKALGG